MLEHADLPPPAEAGDSPAIGVERYDVRAYEVNGRRELTVPALCNYLQNAASNHARALGFGIAALEAQGLTWVLCRLRLVLVRTPMWHNTVTIETWPSELNRVCAFREFGIYDSAGGQIGAATTSWMVLNSARRRPVGLPGFVREVALARRTRLVELPEVNLVWPAGATPVASQSWRAGGSDLDFNQHVNHVRYIAWCLDTLPPALADGSRLQELDIQFLAELGPEENVTVETIDASGEGGVAYMHRLRRVDDGVVLALARTVWAAGAMA